MFQPNRLSRELLQFKDSFTLSKRGCDSVLQCLRTLSNSADSVLQSLRTYFFVIKGRG